jgi:hypothetical protein
MKTEKLSLKGIKNVLSRAELKKIMAGSGGCSCGVGAAICCQCYSVSGPIAIWVLSCSGGTQEGGYLCEALGYADHSTQVSCNYCAS